MLFAVHVRRLSSAVRFLAVCIIALLAGESLADVGRAAWVGATRCASCHANEYQAWQTSHHALAMQVASDKSVLGNFDKARFGYAGITSTFFRRDGKFFVNTDGPDGKLHDYEIAYTFGFKPLQQYLIALPGGRLQAFGIAWDARPRSDGGGRWFHVYPDLKVKAGNPLHWTGIDQNWNYQCAECHSTRFEKNYDADKKAFASSWSEINVSCESCHGPGLKHVSWAAGPREDKQDKGLATVFDERRNVNWAQDPQTGQTVRSSPRTSNREIETCARCHARRGQFSDSFIHGQTLGDSFRPATLDPGLYWADGQMRDEVYNYGSFLQSRMHAQGVTCSDCHEPHSQRLRAPGNAVCGQCHLLTTYAAPKHHHHTENSKGSQCAECHMRTTTYMQVDPRHDHSFRIPRPDLSQKLGIPNACNQCHAAKTPGWAMAAIKEWTGGRPPGGFQRFAQVLHDAGTGSPPAKDIVSGLIAVAGDVAHSPIARATALARLGDYPTPAAMASAKASLYDADPMVREAALNALSHADDTDRARLLAPLLQDKVRSVRMAAARALVGAPERLLGNDSSFKAALAEYFAAQKFNADRPESHVDLGALHVDRGDVAAAEGAFRTAIELDRSYLPATINLADLYRSLGREADSEAALRQALAHSPRAAMLHHVLGLSLVRQMRKPEALAELRLAASMDRGNVRFGYIYAIALHDAGKVKEAIGQLRQSLARAPRNAVIRAALREFSAELP